MGHPQKKVVLCISGDDNLNSSFKELKNSGYLNGKAVHLVHLVEQQVYSSEFAPIMWPTDDKFKEMKPLIEKRLNHWKNELIQSADQQYCHFEIMLSTDSKSQLVKYLKDNKINEVVTVTRGKHGIEGFFSSSLTEYLVKYSPCSLYVLRNH